jgi:hypothetical protein
MRCAVALVALLVAWPAVAQERPLVQQSQMPGHDPTNCFCRAQGRMFAEGESVCLKTAEGPRIAECQMVTNVMSWGITAKPCPET